MTSGEIGRSALAWLRDSAISGCLVLCGIAMHGAARWLFYFLGKKLKGETMLEGSELKGNIGSIGSYEADLDSQGNLEVKVGIKLDLIAECEKLAAKTGTTLDDSFVAVLKKLMGRA